MWPSHSLFWIIWPWTRQQAVLALRVVLSVRSVNRNSQRKTDVWKSDGIVFASSLFFSLTLSSPAVFHGCSCSSVSTHIALVSPHIYWVTSLLRLVFWSSRPDGLALFSCSCIHTAVCSLAAPGPRRLQAEIITLGKQVVSWCGTETYTVHSYECIVNTEVDAYVLTIRQVASAFRLKVFGLHYEATGAEWGNMSENIRNFPQSECFLLFSLGYWSRSTLKSENTLPTD